jgi:hypothetical protein
VTTAFPGAIDAFTNPVAADPLDSVTVPHASQHANINDAVEAIETAIGTTAAPVLAKLASPTFTGTPTLPTGTIAVTQTVGNNTTAVATTAFVIANRDTSFGFTTGLYYKGLGPGSQTAAAVVNQTVYAPFIVNKTNTFDRIAIETLSSYVGTGAVRLGIYNNDNTTGKPSTVVLDAGTVATTAASTIYQITISQSLSAGNYWLAFNMQTAAATPNYRLMLVSTASSLGYTVSTTGALASDAGIWLQASVTGAFATAGTLTSANVGSSCTLRST